MTTNINIDASAYVKKTDLPSNLTLYPTTTASDIATYFKLVTEIADPDYDNPAVDVATGAITGSNQLISSLATSAGILTGNPGIFTVSTVGNIRRTSGSGEAEFYFEIYQRNASGTETLIATSNATSSVSNTTYEQFNASALFNNGTFLPTDRIVLKFYGSKVGGGSNPSYQFQFGGSEPVRTIVPVPASVLLDVPIQVGVTEIIGGTSGKVLLNNSGVVGDIAIDTTPTNGSTNLIDSNAVYDGLAAKQDTLQSGTNIKTVLGDSLLGNGDVTIDLDDLSNVDSTGKNTGDVLEWNAVSGKWEAATPSGGGGGTPAGSSGEIQFNDSGSFGADSAFVWDNTNKRLGVGASPASTVRLDVRAQGALSTDIAFRVRNSGDSANLFEVAGNGTLWARGAGNNQFNTAFGQGALDANTTGEANTAFGVEALTDITTGGYNTAVGIYTLRRTTTGGGNVAIGDLVMAQSNVGNRNTGVGGRALRYNQASDNTGIGGSALSLVTTGYENTALGSLTLDALTTGNSNTGLGHGSLSSITTATNNTAVGWYSGVFLTSGSNNVLLGWSSGHKFGTGSGTNLTTLDNSIFIGYDTRANANNETNQIVIGHNAIGTGSNSVTLGNTSITRTNLRGQVVISGFAAAPTGVEGAIYYDTVLKKHYGFDGTTWNALY